MSDLARFQAAFGAALADADFASPDPALARALAVHRNTSAKAATDALSANYPVLAQLAGAESFSAFASAFVRAYPPADPRLCLYGGGVPAFLADYPPYASTPYLADVAALERLYTEALFAADAPALAGEDALARLDLDAPLPLHPACRFQAFASPAVSLWRAHQADAPADALDTLDWRGEIALVARPEDRVLVQDLSPGAFAFLTACRQGSPLSEAAMAALEAGSDLSTLFGALITAGAFSA